ncbi:hypothetical protein Tco_1517290 [Tanacetum coccineum]
MDDPNITLEEYIRLEEEKTRKCEKVFNWETAKYGKIWNDDDIHDLRSVETEFPAIAFNDGVSSKTLSCEPTLSSLNDEIDFRISFDDSDDEDYTVIFKKNSFSYKKISTNDLKTDSKNDNNKVIPSLPSPKPAISCFDDLDFFKDFENEFPAIVYNDALKSKSDLLTEPILNPQHVDEFDLKNKTPLSEYDEEKQNVLYFNDLFPFNVIHPDDLKSDEDNDNNEIDGIQSLKGSEITHGSNVLYETSHDKINKTSRTGSFVINLNVNIVIWNYYANGMLFYLIMNLYVAFGVLFDPKRYYKDGNCAIMLQRPRGTPFRFHIADQYGVFDFGGFPDLMAEGLSGRMIMEHRDAQGTVGFGAYWADSARQIPDKRDLRDYWIGISSTGDFLGTTPSYTAIRDHILRLCHRLIACSIAGRSQAPEKVTVMDLLYLRGMDVGSVNVPYLLARYLRLFAAGRKSGAHIFGGQFVARLAEHFGLLTAEILGGLTVIALKLPIIDMGELVRLQICMEVDDTWAWVAMGPERQPDTAAGALRVAHDAPIIYEGSQADPAPVHAPPPPPVAARTMP